MEGDSKKVPHLGKPETQELSAILAGVCWKSTVASTDPSGQQLLALEDSPGADSGITAPPSTNHPTEQKRQEGGVDKLTASLYGTPTPHTHTKILPQIILARAKAAEETEAQYIELKGGKAEVLAHGTGKGKNYLPYIVKRDGITLAFRAEEGTTEQRVAAVDVAAIRLMEGHEEAWQEARDLAMELGLKIETDVIGRGDLCVDIIGVAAGEFAKLYMQGARITRANKWELFGDGLAITGVAAGRSNNCRWTAYDKLAEMKHRKDSAKYDAMLELRYDGEEPEVATRVEFQLGREFLRTRNITTVREFFDAMQTMAEYLTGHWLRLVTEQVKGKNHATATVAAIWQKVQEAFAAWTTGTTEIARVRRRIPEPKQMLAQVKGCLASVFAVMPELPDSYQEYRELIERFGALMYQDLMRAAGEKRDRNRASGELGWWEGIIDRPLQRDAHPGDCFCDECITPIPGPTPFPEFA